MDLADLDRLYWILIYWRDIMTTTAISSMSLGWVCLFRAFAGKVAGATTIHTEVICLVSPLFDLGQLPQTHGVSIHGIFMQGW